jgi:hypothetical protein
MTTYREVFVANIIAPILPILNNLLAKNLRGKLEVQIFSEVHKPGSGRSELIYVALRLQLTI